MVRSSTSAFTSPEFNVHDSFSAIVSKYDGFILDQFGVMHNGENGLEGAPECVDRLAKMGKKLIILSNTSSPSNVALAKLPKLGFDKNHFLGAVTSGEEASHFIRENYGDDENDSKALWFTWPSDKAPQKFLKKCGSIDLVDPDNASEADFIIAHGSEVIQGPTEETEVSEFFEEGDLSNIRPILEECVENNVPMICANPDFITVQADGSKVHMPGKIAQLYEELGGECTYFGKPHAAHFEACVRDLGLAKDRVAHVGDSLHHDIAGANEAGIDSIFIAGGVHREELDADLGEVPEVENLQKIFEREGHFPTHVVPMLKL